MAAATSHTCAQIGFRPRIVGDARLVLDASFQTSDYPIERGLCVPLASERHQHLRPFPRRTRRARTQTKLDRACEAGVLGVEDLERFVAPAELLQRASPQVREAEVRVGQRLSVDRFAEVRAALFRIRISRTVANGSGEHWFLDAGCVARSSPFNGA